MNWEKAKELLDMINTKTSETENERDLREMKERQALKDYEDGMAAGKLMMNSSNMIQTQTMTAAEAAIRYGKAFPPSLRKWNGTV